MTSRSPKEPRKAYTLAQERIQQQSADFPEEEEEEEEYYQYAALPPQDSKHEDSEDEYIASDEGDDDTDMPSPRLVRTRMRNPKDDSDEPSPKRLRTQPRNTRREGDGEEAKFDNEAYQKANECPPWHPSTKQPDEDDEEFKPVLDRRGEIVESIQPTPSQRMSTSPAPSRIPGRKRSLATIRLEKAVARTEKNLAQLELDEHLAMIDEDEEMTG